MVCARTSGGDSRRISIDPRLWSRVAVTFVLTAIALSGCRPFFSPVDPGSAGFTGETVLRNPPAGAALPAIERWESVADHAGQPFALEITDGSYLQSGFFVEPRNPVGSRVVLTFAAPVSEQKLAA
ncbi:MAG: hypothetical protein EA382_17385, partial [Spirochaetaceae bacterium]